VKIAVLFGGDSMERDVSAASAAQVVPALRANGHDVAVFDAARGRLAPEDEHRVLAGRIDRLPPPPAAAAGLAVAAAAPELARFDLVFLALHGGRGENGTIQALLDLVGVPYTGSGVLGSAIGMDKEVSKRLFRDAGVPTPPWLTAPADAREVEAELGFPVIVKPNAEGSTVGLTLVQRPDELDAAIAAARAFDRTVLIERYIEGRELTVGVLEDRALAVGEIIPSTGPIFDYHAKYQAGAAQEIFPADLPPAVTARAQALALEAHRALRLDCYSRADFRLDAAGELWCLEVNTLPGLTSGSLLPRSARAAGIAFEELCERICRAALARADKAPS